MINRDPKCVYVADSPAVAEVVVGWLAGQNIPAQTMDGATLGGFDGLTWLSNTAVSARGIEVWVLDPNQADAARQLLEQHAEELAVRDAALANSSASVEAACEECGEVNVFPGSDRGKVQTCRHCGEYLDVPGPDDDLAGAEGEEGAEGRE